MSMINAQYFNFLFSYTCMLIRTITHTDEHLYKVVQQTNWTSHQSILSTDATESQSFHCHICMAVAPTHYIYVTPLSKPPQYAKKNMPALWIYTLTLLKEITENAYGTMGIKPLCFLVLTCQRTTFNSDNWCLQLVSYTIYSTRLQLAGHSRTVAEVIISPWHACTHMIKYTLPISVYSTTSSSSSSSSSSSRVSMPQTSMHQTSSKWRDTQQSVLGTLAQTHMDKKLTLAGKNCTQEQQHSKMTPFPRHLHCPRLQGIWIAQWHSIQDTVKRNLSML